MQVRNIYRGILQHPRTVVVCFVLAALFCAFLAPLVSVNYNMMDYLPEDSPSTVALRELEREFSLSIPNCRVMVRGVSVPQALEMKAKLETVEGVRSVTWLDDSVSLAEPLEMLPEKTVRQWYKDGAALFSLSVEKGAEQSAYHDIEALVGDAGLITGSVANSVTSRETAGREVASILAVVVPFCAVLLALVSASWLEPLLFLSTIGFAIVLNLGTNLIFGEISFVTQIAGSVLQLAVSLDYSLFLLHRFEECRHEIADPQEAMLEALCRATPSILASGLTTVMGFAALMAMRFGIGADLGRVLAKGILFSLLAVLLLLPVLTLRLIRWVDRFAHRPLIPPLYPLGKAALKMRRVSVVLFLLAIVPAFLAQNSNSFFYGSSRLFAPDTPQGEKQAAVEAVFGESNTFVLLLPKGDIAKERALNEDLRRMPEVASILSYADTVGAEIPEEYLDEDTLSQLMSEHYSCMILTAEVPAEGEEAFDFVRRLEALTTEYYADGWHLAGDTASTFDLKDTVESDLLRVNVLVIGAVFLILVLTLRTLALPLLLLLVIETSVWLNLAVPYFTGQTLFFIAYLIITSIQLGATVDYAILMGSRYQEERRSKPREQAITDTVGITSVSIMTPAAILSVAGFLIGSFCTNGAIAELGVLLGRGALISCLLVLLVLPACLYDLDRFFIKPQPRPSGAPDAAEEHPAGALPNEKGGLPS